MLTEPIPAILVRLAESASEALPVTGAGVSLIAPGVAPHLQVGSDDAALRMEQLQSRCEQAPCQRAHDLGRAVCVPDLAFDERFPDFGGAAEDIGLRSVFAFPLRHAGTRLGALDLYRDKPGSLRPYEMDVAQVLADVTAAYLVNAHDREQVQVTADRHRASALHDPLTGLPNRVQFQQRLEHAAQSASRSHSTAAVLYADLDRFKRVNDLHGHAVGDELLVAVAARLHALLRPGDTLARLSGDEFAFLCEDITAERDAQHLAVRIRGAFVRPFPLTAGAVSVTASVGIAYAGPGEAVTMDLVSRADRAMYQAKRAGGTSSRGAVVDLEVVRDHALLAPDLRDAMESGELELVYQPIVATGSASLCGGGAELRWNHRDLGPIAASTTLRIAEENGWASTLGAWVLSRSCRDALSWRAAAPASVPFVSVPVSGVELMAHGFCGLVADVLERTGMPADGLVLELPEAPMQRDPERAVRLLSTLSSLGVRLALDGFGSGGSALRSLRERPFDTVKIGPGLVAAMGLHEGGTAVVTAVVDLAHVLGLSVLAEGLQHEGQRHALAGLGCEHARGPLFGPPLTAEHLPGWIGAPRVPAAREGDQDATSARST
jgi:diguanylate cyclase (GGDEF)-like protein